MAGLPEGMADLQQLFQLGQQMQGRLQQLQTELAGRASAGGGMVKVISDGRGTVRGVWIDPTIFDAHDADFLSDLVLTALAEAQRRAAEMLQSEMRKVPQLPFPSPF